MKSFVSEPYQMGAGHGVEAENTVFDREFVIKLDGTFTWEMLVQQFIEKTIVIDGRPWICLGFQIPKDKPLIEGTMIGVKVVKPKPELVEKG